MQPLNFAKLEEIYNSAQWYVTLIINECAMIYCLACDKIFFQKITNPIDVYTQAFTQEYTVFYGGIWLSSDPFGLNEPQKMKAIFKCESYMTKSDSPS